MDIQITINHNKFSYIQIENAQKYIKETFHSCISKPFQDIIHNTVFIRPEKDGQLIIKTQVKNPEIEGRVDLIKNRISKMNKKFCKKFNQQHIYVSYC